ncbi:MAG: AmmeMemoRadiSam system protein B [Desulfobacteraceae bacterium IS3]|nr:MAG: AmmeMemoRadiSam system protein B [Desulfobacteraceae bacterium IS3]
MNTRKAVFAGSWYPASAADCEKEIRYFLNEAKPVSKRNFVGGIVPHAGWYFSGSIACNVIRLLSEPETIDVVAIFGMHLGPGSACHIMAEGTWETPFGELEIEEGIAGELTQKFQFNIETPRRFTQDNTIELQLPFIKYFFKDVKILPLGLPPDEKSLEIAKTLVEIAARRGVRIKVIGSTDLTHYGMNYGFTPKGSGGTAPVDWVRKENDKKVIDVMLALDAPQVIREALKNHNACCAGAAAGAIAAAKQLGAQKAEMTAYASSYDKHPGDSFVGYTGIVFNLD